MIQKKVCLMGAYAAGKTSLASRYLRSMFSEKYLTTVGVRVDRHITKVDNQELSLILWDLHGEDEFQRVRKTYLRGSAGYVLVVDGTRRATLDRAMAMQQENEDVIGNVPFIVALNKHDLAERWEIPENMLAELTSRGWDMIRTSAKTGEGVEKAFLSLARKMLRGRTIGVS
jgi:small GTP-binding protein